jgi:hypothetical protein
MAPGPRTGQRTIHRSVSKDNFCQGLWEAARLLPCPVYPRQQNPMQTRPTVEGNGLDDRRTAVKLNRVEDSSLSPPTARQRSPRQGKSCTSGSIQGPYWGRDGEWASHGRSA